MSYFSLPPSLLRGLGASGAALLLIVGTLSGPSALASDYEPSHEHVEDRSFFATSTASAVSTTTTTSTPTAGPAQQADPEANLPYLFAVFIVAWGAFFGYLFYISRRQKDMRREIDALRADFAQRDAKLDDPQVPGAG